MVPFPPTPPVRAQDGFTLMELLMAMLTAIVVVGALLSILDISLQQESRVVNRAQANQIGRTAMSNIIDQLHSACTGTTPIQLPSGTLESLEPTGITSLWFISSYGDSDTAEAELKEVTMHDIVWSKTSTSNTGLVLGKLTDYQFAGSGTPGSWTFKSPLKPANASATKVIAENVIRPTGGAIFQYFKYETNSTSADYDQLVPITSSELEKLTTTGAASIAKVTISYTQAPVGESGVADTRADRTVSFSDSVVFRLDPTTSGSEGPCE
ncbi:MAG TPA: type II secretion system protein [Solirubrobacteraceae bacterium]|nr:type II secretion system protein [Solirubrobacteraceae bacterium]